MSYKKCLKYKGKLYCWNESTDTVDEISVRRLNIEDCPPEITKDLIRLLTDKAEVIQTNIGDILKQI